MVFQIQKTSNLGTSTPAVARTFYQGCEIIRFFAVADAQREEAKGVLQELQRHLVRCVEIRDQIATQVASAHEEVGTKGLDFHSGGQAVTLPSVPDLQSKAESFLQSAKLAIREAARLTQPFYRTKLDHRFHKFVAWAEGQFGPDDRFTKAVKSWEPWVKRLVDMRNAVDHPADEPGQKLITQNFKLSGMPDAPALADPTWGLLGEPQRPILRELSEIIDRIIELGEQVLTELFYKLKDDFPLVIREIPIEERDPSCPTRLRVSLASQEPTA